MTPLRGDKKHTSAKQEENYKRKNSKINEGTAERLGIESERLMDGYARSMIVDHCKAGLELNERGSAINVQNEGIKQRSYEQNEGAFKCYTV